MTLDRINLQFESRGIQRPLKVELVSVQRETILEKVCLECGNRGGGVEERALLSRALQNLGGL